MAKALQDGNKVPAFSLPDENGKMFDIHEVLGEHILVIYFYPKDDTPGCTTEACTFRDHFEDLTDAGAVVIGISSDSPQSHKRFKEKYRLPFKLLSDQDKKVRDLFGVPSSLMGLLPGRVTYIIDRDGVIKHVFNSQLNAAEHVEVAKNIIRQLQDAKTSQTNSQASGTDSRR